MISGNVKKSCDEEGLRVQNIDSKKASRGGNIESVLETTKSDVNIFSIQIFVF